MNADSDDYYYKKNWFVIKDNNKYFSWCKSKNLIKPLPIYSIIREDLNWFESVKLVKILNKLKGK